MSALIKLSSKINCRSSPAWTYCSYPFKPWLSAQIPPTKYIFVYNSLAYRNLYAKITGDIPPNLQVKPTKHILGARLDQRLCRKGCSYGALNFKPENTSTKVLDYIYQSLSGATLATYPRSDGEATLAKRWSKHKMFRNCDFIGVIRVSLQTNQIPWIRWKKFLEPQWNLLQQIGDHFLTFVWWGGNDPETSHKLGMCMYIGICLC